MTYPGDTRDAMISRPKWRMRSFIATIVLATEPYRARPPLHKTFNSSGIFWATTRRTPSFITCRGGRPAWTKKNSATGQYHERTGLRHSLLPNRWASNTQAPTEREKEKRTCSRSKPKIL